MEKIQKYVIIKSMSETAFDGEPNSPIIGEGILLRETIKLNGNRYSLQRANETGSRKLLFVHCDVMNAFNDPGLINDELFRSIFSTMPMWVNEYKGEEYSYAIELPVECKDDELFRLLELIDSFYFRAIEYGNNRNADAKCANEVKTLVEQSRLHKFLRFFFK